MSRSLLRAGIVAAAMVGVSVAAASPAAAVCKSSVIRGTSVGTFKTTTSLAARAIWRSKVRKRYGYKWAFWSKANDSATGCEKIGTGRWQCTARARPCH
jgi:hypothetical protein